MKLASYSLSYRLFSLLLPCAVVFSALLVSGCSSSNSKIGSSDPVAIDRQSSPLSKQALQPFPSQEVSHTTRSTDRLPWELWPLSRDLSGTPLSHPSILEGDELVRVGRREDALRIYTHAGETVSSDAENAEVVIRLASNQLALDRAEWALETLSEFFKGLKTTEDQVDERFSIIFGYAYGRKGDVDQSYAWFSKIHRLTAGRGPEADAARRGVALLARTFTNQKLYEVSSRWSGDSFISQILSRESRRRGYGGFVEPRTFAPGRFWEIETGPITSTVAVGGDGVNLGVLLPLTGRYGNLGKSTKQGVELALLGQPDINAVTPLYRDTAGDTIEASAAFREITSSGKTPVVLGPLLSDVATTVSNLARPSKVNIFALSKRSSFATGEGIFRLGPTIESQISSLVKMVTASKGYKRYAVIAPSTTLGDHYTELFQEYARRSRLDVRYVGRYSPELDTTLVALVNDLLAADVEAVFFPGTLEEASRFRTNLPIYEREKIAFLGLGTWDDPKAIRRSRTVLEGSIFVSPFFRESKRAVIVRFREAYKRKFGSQPDFLAAQGFDAATLIVSALERGRVEELPLPRALTQIELYEGLTGDIEVAPNGELRRQFAVVELRRGKLQELAIPQNASKAVKETFVVRGNQRL